MTKEILNAEKDISKNGVLAEHIKNGKHNDDEKSGGWTDYLINGVKVGSWKMFGKRTANSRPN